MKKKELIEKLINANEDSDIYLQTEDEDMKLAVSVDVLYYDKVYNEIIGEDEVQKDKPYSKIFVISSIE